MRDRTDDRAEPGDVVAVRLKWDGRHLVLRGLEVNVDHASWVAEWWRPAAADLDGDEIDDDRLVESGEFDDVRDAIHWCTTRSTAVRVNVGALGVFAFNGFELRPRFDLDSPPVPLLARAAAREEIEMVVARQFRRQRDLRRRDATSLREARVASGLAPEDLAAQTGIDTERLRDAENADPPLELTFSEWVRLAVAFQGTTWEDHVASRRRDAGWVAGRGHMLQAAQKLIREVTA